jgi:patatin-like phospholipase/acyl hydrolase
LRDRRFQILSLDGGGIRGLFAAAVLAAVEEDVQTSVTEHFDLIAGTSTGGIVAIALGLGLRPAEIVSFYEKFGPRIFSNPMGWRWFRQWVTSKYAEGPLEAALRETLGERLFGESRKRLVVPAYNLNDDDVYVFRTPHAAHLRRDHRLPAWQVALATAAAPTFFPACRSVDRIRLIDGGVWANNPTMVAIVEAIGPLGVPLDQVHVLSVGTYDEVRSRSRRLDRGGLVAWAKPAIDIILRASSIGVTNHARFLLGAEQFYRVDPKVPRGEAILDRSSNIDDLVARGRHHSRKHMPEMARRFLAHRAASYAPSIGQKE